MYELDGEGRPESWATHCMQWMRLPLRQRCYYSSPSQPSTRYIHVYDNAHCAISKYVVVIINWIKLIAISRIGKKMRVKMCFISLSCLS